MREIFVQFPQQLSLNSLAKIHSPTVCIHLYRALRVWKICEKTSVLPVYIIVWRGRKKFYLFFWPRSFWLAVKNIKVNFIFLARLFVLWDKSRRYLALAVKNIKVNFIFLARLFVLWDKSRRYLALAVKNIKVNFIFLARLFVSLQKSDYLWYRK